MAVRNTVLAAPSPSTPLGPLEDGIVTWTTWVTLMGFVGVLALALIAVGPVARRAGSTAGTTTRLVRVALVLGVLAVPAVLTDVAHGVEESGGYHYAAAWDQIYDGSNAGRLLGLELTLMLVGVLLLAPLAFRSIAGGRWPTPLLAGAVAAGAVALGTSKFPDEIPDQWARESFETVMWMLHLLGGAVWIGGLIGLLALAAPGGVPANVAGSGRASFWSPVIRRFSVAAMTCVAAIALSGLWLSWTHVDGPSQLLSTMYGRVLGVKILIFGTLLVLGAVNQFWLHPKIDARRAAGDERSVLSIVTREFPAVVAAEVLLGLSVLMVAPFLHGSARNQAYQEGVAERSATVIPVEELPRLDEKQVRASTWAWGASETVVVVGLMAGGFAASGRLARRWITVSPPAAVSVDA